MRRTNNRGKYAVKFILIILLFASCSYGAFNIVNPTARVLGMGNSFVAVADDLNSIYSNPAGLGNLKSWETIFSYSKLHLGVGNLNESLIGIGVPFKEFGTIGIGWYNFNDTLYKEDVVYLVYACLIKDSSFGINLKYLNKSYVSNEWTQLNPYFSSLSKDGYSLGLSLFTYVLKDVSFGLFADDINEPSIGIGDGEKLPMSIRSGVCYYMDKTSLISTEILYRNSQWKIHLGGEKTGIAISDFGLFSFRAGGGFGADSYFNFTLGFGCKFNIPYVNTGCEFDYGFALPLAFASGTSGTHKVSITIRDIFKELTKNKDTEE